MAENSKIEWCDHTWNPWRGCVEVSPACDNCYAREMSKRNPAVLGVWGDHGTRVVASEAQWKLPLKWNREAAAAGVRRRVFCASMADVFEGWNGPMVDSKSRTLHQDDGGWHTEGRHSLEMTDVRRRLFGLIDATPNLDWLLLTKRPENISKMLPAQPFDGPGWNGTLAGYWHQKSKPRPNVWLGVTVEDQQRADERIPLLLQVQAAVRFLSVEPMLGPVDLTAIRTAKDCEVSALSGVYRQWSDEGIDHPGAEQRFDGGPRIHWVICGGESGHGARPMYPHWAQSLRDQCQAAGVPFFFKQWGEFNFQTKNLLDGRTWDEFPKVGRT